MISEKSRVKIAQENSCASSFAVWRRLRRSFPLCFSKRRKVVPVSQHHPWQLTNNPKTGNENTRLSKQANEPTEIDSISPFRNCDLVASQKPEGCADAMDGRTIVEVLFQVTA